jgi:sucrose phosphorylase
MAIKNQVQLITYPDSLGGNLKILHEILLRHFADIVSGGIHILPPFPSSGDRGFAPLTYLDIDPAHGTWEDIRHIGEDFDILLDLMVNHISQKSVYFQDFLKHGRASEYADMFLPIKKYWPTGDPPQQDIDKIFLRRPRPFSTFTIEETGEQTTVWTTFGKTDPSEQIDLDIDADITRNVLQEFFSNFSRNNVKIVRLDAVGYVIKKIGTSCFFVEPEIYQFLDWITEMAHSVGIELLPEVHAHYTTQYKLAERGHWIYDFILPYSILSTLITHNSAMLQEYLKTRPHKQFTMLDCHDGVPVKPDMDDLVSTTEARKIVDTCIERGSNLSLIHSSKYKSPDGFDVHQIRGTYYSMLGCNDDAYLAARAIQFFTPGVPQVYYVGLLAGENDEENIKKTGDGREINRHNFTVAEIERALQNDVVQRLLKLIRFRNEYPAFHGDFTVLDSDAHTLRMMWEQDAQRCQLTVDVETYQAVIAYTDEAGQKADFSV